MVNLSAVFTAQEGTKQFSKAITKLAMQTLVFIHSSVGSRSAEYYIVLALGNVGRGWAFCKLCSHIAGHLSKLPIKNPTRLWTQFPSIVSLKFRAGVLSIEEK